MKKSLSVLVVIALFACPSLRGQADNAKKETAIKAVIEGEIKASFNGEYDNWASFFVQEPYLVWMQASKERYSCWKGWQEISTNAKNFVKPERKGSLIHNGNSDYTIRFYNNGAFVTFKCKITNISEGQSTQEEAWEARILENQGGKWKIAYLSSIYTSTYN
ncbi:MAG TPA: hypothetical protein VMV47_02355 [Bacteroidales bacterium]|nr:hypothetical protein [Bacteroidales bacterium]